MSTSASTFTDGATSRPVLARTRDELAEARRAALAARPDGEVAVVMTMGALHAGHQALIERARARAAVVIVTIFVNPLQFGPNEDLDRYPRTLDADLSLAASAGADIVFAPSVQEVYPGGRPRITVDPGEVGERLEGEFRPGFFRGVLTVVAKLLALTAPDVTYFGQKDAQQLALVRRMTLDLNLPVEVVGVPTVREPDGLAGSSRNRYLAPSERTTALALVTALRAGEREAPHGAARALEAARLVLESARRADPPLRTDYLALVDPVDFTDVPPERCEGEALLVVAARVGDTRLIDNHPISLGSISPTTGE